MEIVRLLIAGGEPLFGQLLGNALSGDAEIEVVGIVRDGETAIRMANDEAPDAVIMDIELEGALDGIEAGLAIKAHRPETGIVVLTALNDRSHLARLPLNQSQGWAYLLKQSVPDLSAVLSAVRGSIDGMLALDPNWISVMWPRENPAISGLTPRQLAVLRLIANGFNNAAIAEQLGLVEKSIETYINAIYQEMGLAHEPNINSRVSATLIYLEDSAKFG
jgi:DNA-binding NarL/FixJ family response regulator